MEGARRGAVPLLAAVAACVAAVVAGCGASADEVPTVTAKDPAKAFAPVVVLHPRERFMPMGARWFISRSVLWFSEGRGVCDDRKIAVGKLLKGQQNEVVDWMFITGIGKGPAYWREPYKDANCDLFREAYRYYANQLTRPHDPSPDRAPELQAAEGYFLDLMDWGRGGPRPLDADGQATVAGARAWYERERVEVDGEPGLEITYWMLYGMNRPHGRDGRPVAELTHEGDWERVRVVLRGEDGEWQPVGVRLAEPDGSWRKLPWSAVRRVDGGDRAAGSGAGERTHPLLFAARGSHSLYPTPGDRQRDVDLDGGERASVIEATAPACAACPRWETWRALSPVHKRHWFGFGGAWGEPGPTSATTGPLGPHGDDWPESARDPNVPPRTG